jgi:hypothetical protein
MEASISVCKKLSRPQCVTRKRTNGKCEHYHAWFLGHLVRTAAETRATLAAFTPLDVVGTFQVRLHRAVDAHLVFDPTLEFGDNGREEPASVDFVFLCA